MKLTIEIPKEYYELLQEFDDSKCTADMLIIKHGIPKPKYERFLPCKCGCNRREEWTGYVNGTPITTLVCEKCEHAVAGRSFADAKRNWNEQMQEVDG